MTLAAFKVDPELGSPLPLKRSQIVPDPEQPRRTFVEAETVALADAIQREGQETPIHVFKHPDPVRKGLFMISAGERRWRAFGIIAERTGTDPIIMSYLKTITDRKQQFRKAFIENLHRKDLVPLDEAASYLRLRTDDETIDSIATMADRSVSHVINYLKLNDLCDEVKALMDPNLPEHKQLSVTSAIDVAKSIKQPKLQLEIANEIVSRQLNVTDTRLMLQVRADNPNYREGDRIRKPSDDYKMFKTFLGRTRIGMHKFAQSELGRMYAFRDDDEGDRKRDIDELRVIRDSINNMIGKLLKEEQ